MKCFLYFVLFFTIKSSLPMPSPIFLKYPILPLVGVTVPTVNSSTQVLIIGGRGIALATAKTFYALGATVSVTTRCKETYDMTQLAGTSIRVFEYEHGRTAGHVGTYKDFVRKYRHYHHKNPDIIYDCGMTVYAGYVIDYDEEHLNYAMGMYLTGPLLLEKEFLKFNDPNQQVTLVHSLSTAAFTAPPFFQTFYNMRHWYKWNHIVGSNAAKVHPNWLHIGVACTDTNTTWFNNLYNPSALIGDEANIVFDEKLAAATGAKSIPPETVALAVAQAVFLRKELDDETIFQVPDLTGVTTTALLNAVRQESGKNFTQLYIEIALIGFGINMTVH